jgi:hypothetical protein
MHLCFVDESGRPAKDGNDKSQYLVIAGLVIPDDKWMSLHNKIQGLKIASKYHGEIKWRFFAPENVDEENPMRDWTFEQRCEFRSAIFKILRETPGLSIVSCVSQASAAYRLNNVKNQADLYYYTYKPVTERFQYLLQQRSPGRQEPEYGLIVADHRGRADDEHLRKQHQRLLENRGEYASTYTHLIEALLFAPSHMSTGVQMADMVGGAIWRRFAKGDDKSFNEIAGLIRKSPHNVVDGWGIVRFPKANWTGPIVEKWDAG